MNNAYIENFLEMLIVQRGALKNTVISYKTDLLLFCQFIGNKRSITEITTDDILKYITHLKKNGLSERSIARKITVLRQLYTFLYLEKTIQENPMKTIAQPKKSSYLPKHLTYKEIQHLFDYLERNHPNTLRIHAMLEMLYSSGMRVSELLNLKVADTRMLSASHTYITILGKGNKERVIPFSKKAICILDKYRSTRKRDDSICLFPGHTKRDQPLSRQRLAQLIKEIAILSNIDPHKISAHVMRHSFATHLLDRGMDIKVLQELLGHSQITTTQIYTHLSKESLYMELEKKHPLSKRKNSNI